MKVYSHAILTAALALPAFCQAPAPLPEPQPQAFAEQAAKALADSERLSADRMAEIQAKVAEAAEKVRTIDAEELAARGEAKIREVQDRLGALPDLNLKLEDLQFRLDADLDTDLDIKLQQKLSDLELKMGDMAFLQEGKVPPVPPVPPAPMVPKSMRISIDRGDREYDSGTRALDQHHYDDAVGHFDQVINSKTARADGALYWKAYALNRAGKRDEALAALAQLRRDYASSAWLNDAQALENEVKQSSGQPVSPAQESSDDLKLLAINSLMNADAERAIPLIDGILKGNSPPSVKRNALFVLTQSRSPHAQQLLNDYAKGGGNPDLQLQAIRYLGQSRSRDVQQQLGGIYGTATDPRVKATIIDSLSNSRAFDALMNIAKTEKDDGLRRTAIRAIANNRSAPLDGLLEMYPNVDESAKIAIIDGLQSRRDGKTMVDLARKESDPRMKRRIVERLGNMHENKDAMDYMMEILRQ